MKRCEFESHSGEVYSIQHYVIKFCQRLVVGRWFSPSTLVSSTNKTYHHDITEILLKVALNTITLTLTFNPNSYQLHWFFHIFRLVLYFMDGLFLNFDSAFNFMVFMLVSCLYMYILMSD
jgi:hypothetical protein